MFEMLMKDSRKHFIIRSEHLNFMDTLSVEGEVIR